LKAELVKLESAAQHQYTGQSMLSSPTQEDENDGDIRRHASSEARSPVEAAMQEAKRSNKKYSM